jgi:hypothetical protein
VNRIGLIADWRLTFGTHLGRSTLVLLAVAGALTVAISAISLWRERRRGRTLAILTLRSLAVAACLLVCLQPRLEFGQVSVVPNTVVLLVDASRSMSVAPPDRGPTRSERVAGLMASAAPTFARWESSGHKIEVYGFGEGLTPASRTQLPLPKAEATRIGEALAELRTRFAGRDLGAVVLISDGIDTGSIGRGPHRRRHPQDPGGPGRARAHGLRRGR